MKYLINATILVECEEKQTSESLEKLIRLAIELANDDVVYLEDNLLETVSVVKCDNFSKLDVVSI